MIKLSAIIIAKNAENVIADCIDSVSFCDEIIVIDDRSTDRTTEVAKHLGAHVYPTRSESFADKRNFGLKRAKSRWVMYIDADERVSKTLKQNILDVIEKDEKVFSAYRFQRKNFYFSSYEWPYIEKLERLFRKSSLEGWTGELHESAQVKGEIGELEGFLTHNTHRDLTSIVEKTIEWSKIEANLRLKAQHPKMTWWRFFRVMVTGFYNSYIKQEGWRLGTAGLVESMYQSFSMFITYARLWEMQEKLKAEK